MAQVYNNQLSAAEKNLSSSAQKGIQAAKDAYNAAKARGDTAGMAKANAQANAIRSANNLTTSKTGNDVVSKGTTSGSSGNKTSTSSTSTTRPSGSGSSGSSKVSSNINPNKITSSGNSSYKPSGGSSGNFNYSGSSGSSGGSSGKVVNVAPGGNAPAGTKVGDIVRTAGGDYKVVAPNTPGANYNPTNGLWSVKVSGTGSGSVTTPTAPSIQQPYTPQGTYQDQGLSEADAAKVKALQDYWAYLDSIGASKADKDAVHADAESIRNQYGYSGGGDGSMYIPTRLPEDILPKQGLPVYEPQIEQTNSLYDAARQRTLAALQSAYDQSRLELEKYQAQIPGLYQQQANALAAQAERDRQRFNEYSAQSGLDAGVGSQAALAMQNQQQQSLSQIRTAEANANAEAQSKLASLFTQYQNDIAEALANNEYERAAALLAEYKQRAQSVVSVSQAQSQLDMSVADFNKDTRYTNWQKQMALAEAMAAQGDFSGYRALGVSDDQINSMRRGWLAQNPKAALNLGLASYR